MDRFDERNDAIESEVDPAVDSTEAQSGDVLGLSGSPVPKMPGDPSASADPDSVRRRRERIMEGEPQLSDQDSNQQRAGATGIDVG